MKLTDEYQTILLQLKQLQVITGTDIYEIEKTIVMKNMQALIRQLEKARS